MIQINTRFLVRSAIFVVIFAGAIAGLHSDFFSIASVSVEESPESEGPEVFQNLNAKAHDELKPFLKQNLWWVDVSEVGDRISKLPGVKSVVVERVPPKNLRVVVTPESIRLVYVNPKGQLLPITESTKILSPFHSKIYPDAPITREKRIINNSKLRAQAIDLVSNLPKVGLLSRHSVAEIEIDSKEDFWMSVIQPDVKIKMNPKDAALKVERIERVLDYTRKHNLHARVIDAEYSKKVVVKLRKDR